MPCNIVVKEANLILMTHKEIFLVLHLNNNFSNFKILLERAVNDQVQNDGHAAEQAAEDAVVGNQFLERVSR